MTLLISSMTASMRHFVSAACKHGMTHVPDAGTLVDQILDLGAFAKGLLRMIDGG